MGELSLACAGAGNGPCRLAIIDVHPTIASDSFFHIHPSTSLGQSPHIGNRSVRETDDYLGSFGDSAGRRVASHITQKHVGVLQEVRSLLRTLSARMSYS